MHGCRARSRGRCFPAAESVDLSEARILLPVSSNHLSPACLCARRGCMLIHLLGRMSPLPSRMLKLAYNVFQRRISNPTLSLYFLSCRLFLKKITEALRSTNHRLSSFFLPWHARFSFSLPFQSTIAPLPLTHYLIIILSLV